MCSSYTAVDPGATLTEAGVALSSNDLPDLRFTVRPTATECFWPLLLVPMTAMLYHPTGVAAVVAIVIVAVADVADAVRVGAVGANDTVVPVGTLWLAATSVTGPVSPVVVATVSVKTTDWPCSME